MFSSETTLITSDLIRYEKLQDISFKNGIQLFDPLINRCVMLGLDFEIVSYFDD